MKNIARKLSALLLVFVVSAAALCPAFAATASLPSLPSGQCVVDDANVLSSSTVQTITDLNAQLEKMQLTPEKIEDILRPSGRHEYSGGQPPIWNWIWGTTISTWGRTTISIWQALTRRSWSTPLTWPPSTAWTTRCGCTSRRSARCPC